MAKVHSRRVHSGLVRVASAAFRGYDVSQHHNASFASHLAFLHSIPSHNDLDFSLGHEGVSASAFSRGEYCTGTPRCRDQDGAGLGKQHRASISTCSDSVPMRAWSRLEASLTAGCSLCHPLMLNLDHHVALIMPIKVYCRHLFET
jgi:hypothetical protein